MKTPIVIISEHTNTVAEVMEQDNGDQAIELRSITEQDVYNEIVNAACG